MAVSFNQVPANALVPFTYVEIDPSRAGSTGAAFRTLLIGQRLASGTVAAGVPTPVGIAVDARSKFGAGSMLALMAAAFRRQNPTGQLWAVALDDAAGATDQTHTITVSAAATGAGTISLYISGRRIPVPISGAQAVNAVATAINTAILSAGGGAAGVLPVTSTVAAAVVTLTARNGGASSDIDVRHSYQPDDSLPPGAGLLIAASTAGANDPDITDALDVITDERYNVIAHPYSADAQMDLLEAELLARWGPTRQIDGVAFTGFRGTSAAATTYGNARNSPYSSVMGISTSPTSVVEWAGAIAGAVAVSAAADPALPFQTLPLRGVLPAALANRFSFAERETLLSDGIATHTVDRTGVVALERMVTTYQTAQGGVDDTAFRDVNTLFTLSFLRASLRQRLATKFRRYKLANDGTRFGPGQRVVTPSTARAEVIGLFRQWESAGLVESADAFKEALVIERNENDPNRLDFLIPPDLVNQLRVMAATISFTLQESLHGEEETAEEIVEEEG